MKWMTKESVSMISPFDFYFLLWCMYLYVNKNNAFLFYFVRSHTYEYIHLNKRIIDWVNGRSNESMNKWINEDMNGIVHIEILLRLHIFFFIIYNKSFVYCILWGIVINSLRYFLQPWSFCLLSNFIRLK